MSQLSDIHTFIELSRLAKNPAELDRLILDITREMGFDHYALIHHVDLDNPQQPFSTEWAWFGQKPSRRRHCARP